MTEERMRGQKNRPGTVSEYVERQENAEMHLDQSKRE